MKRVYFFTMTSILPLLVAALVGGEVFAQQSAKTLKEQFVGTWTLVEVYHTTPTGTRVDCLAPIRKAALGSMAMAPIHYKSCAPTCQNSPRTAWKAPQRKTKLSYREPCPTMVSYSVSEPDQIFSVHLHARSLPNFDGADQKSDLFTLNGIY